MSLATDIARIALDRPKFQSIVNGDATTTVATDGGQVPSMARLLSQMGAGTIKGAWVTVTAYVLGDVVTNGGTAYRCILAHTSSAALATDLAAGKWIIHYTATTLTDTIAALKGLANTYGSVIVQGYSAAGDGGGGIFRWDGASAAADNGGTIITPTAAPATGRWMRVYDAHVSLLWFGAAGDGVTDDTTAVQAALNTGRHVLAPKGYTFLVDGNLATSVNRQKISGGGAFKKKSGNVKPVFLLPDESEGVHFDGIEIDGNLAAFTIGNATPAIFGYLIKSLTVTNCNLHSNADAGIKLRDSAGLTAIGNRFYRTQNNGIELRHYINDPRTGSPYVGTRPSVQGNVRVIGNHFERIDDGGHGAGDGCGVTFDSVNGSYPFKNVTVEGNTFQDVLRCVWTENNIAGSESVNVSIVGNTLLGNVLGAGTTECKDGIGLIGVRGATVKGNVIRNISNIVSVGDCVGIQVSGSMGITVAEDIEIEGNIIVDDSGIANRMDYGIKITLANRIRVVGNRVRGASVNQINIAASNVTALACFGNPGAEEDYSWSGCLATMPFWRDNLAISSTLPLYPSGWTSEIELAMPCSGVLVGIVVRLSAAISAGTLTVNPYTNSVLRTNLQVLNADFGGGAIASKRIATESGVVVTAGQRIKVEVVTDGSWAPTTADIHVSLVFDLGQKK
jgi:parallel beta-helix repeat protein